MVLYIGKYSDFPRDKPVFKPEKRVVVHVHMEEKKFAYCLFGETITNRNAALLTAAGLTIEGAIFAGNQGVPLLTTVDSLNLQDIKTSKNHQRSSIKSGCSRAASCSNPSTNRGPGRLTKLSSKV